MSHIKTASGFETDIDEEFLNDFRLMMAIRETKTDKSALVDVVRFILGDNGLNDLVAHLVETEGKPTYDAIEREVTEILAQLNESKKK